MSLHPSTDIIMNAQQQFAADQSQANLVKLLHAISIMLQEGANVLIPIVQGENVPEGQILLQTQTTDNGLEYVTAFSSKEAYELGEPCPTLERCQKECAEKCCIYLAWRHHRVGLRCYRQCC